MKLRLQADLSKYNSKELSLFREDTKDTVFMSTNINSLKKILKIIQFKSFIFQVIRNDIQKSNIAPYNNALLPREELEVMSINEKPKIIDLNLNNDIQIDIILNSYQE